MNKNKENKIDMGWNFDNSYIDLPKEFYKEQNPVPVRSAELILFNEDLADSLGLNSDNLKTKDGIDIFAGNKIPQGANPIAQAYGGHQFGNFTMLGDGRVVLLGEQITPDNKRLDIQLKGSGRTPYSRGGDGRAALGPMLREYIISEGMHGLGIPTTRSLAVVATGEDIRRERLLPGAILTRVGSSHIRVGTFQYIAAYGKEDDLRILADYTIKRHFPDISADKNKYLLLLREVIKRQAQLIAKWQEVGFIHGVMNTDNMTIIGESIDYGPCAFMDTYNPKTVFSSIDHQGRYAYDNQAKIGAWNLARFGETLLPLIHKDQDEALKMANGEMLNFHKIYNKFLMDGMRAKLGIFDEKPEDESIINDLLEIMQRYKADFTNTFRGLTLEEFSGMELFSTDEFAQWKEQWQERLSQQEQTKEESMKLMKDKNPAIIPRNHRVEEALAGAVEDKDLSLAKKLIGLLSDPYAYSSDQEEYSKLPPESSKPYQTFCGT